MNFVRVRAVRQHTVVFDRQVVDVRVPRFVQEPSVDRNDPPLDVPPEADDRQAHQFPVPQNLHQFRAATRSDQSQPGRNPRPTREIRMVGSLRHRAPHRFQHGTIRHRRASHGPHRAVRRAAIVRFGRQRADRGGDPRRGVVLRRSSRKRIRGHRSDHERLSTSRGVSSGSPFAALPRFDSTRPSTFVRSVRVHVPPRIPRTKRKNPTASARFICTNISGRRSTFHTPGRRSKRGVASASRYSPPCAAISPAYTGELPASSALHTNANANATGHAQRNTLCDQNANASQPRVGHKSPDN